MAHSGFNSQQTLELVEAARKANNEVQSAREEFVTKIGNQQRTNADALDALCRDNATISTELWGLQGGFASITAAKDRVERELTAKTDEITVLLDAAHKHTLRSERDSEIIASLSLASTRAAEEMRVKEERMEELEGALQELLNELERQKAEALKQSTQQSERQAELEERLQNSELETQGMVTENQRLEAMLSEERTDSQAQRDIHALRARLQELNEALAQQSDKVAESEAATVHAGKEADRLRIEVAELRLSAAYTTTEAETTATDDNALQLVSAADALDDVASQQFGPAEGSSGPQKRLREGDDCESGSLPKIKKGRPAGSKDRTPRKSRPAPNKGKFLVNTTKPYGIPQKKWDSMSQNNRRRQHHADVINTTADGRGAAAACKRCREKSVPCRFYHNAGQTMNGVKVPEWCSECLKVCQTCVGGVKALPTVL